MHVLGWLCFDPLGMSCGWYGRCSAARRCKRVITTRSFDRGAWGLHSGSPYGVPIAGTWFLDIGTRGVLEEFGRLYLLWVPIADRCGGSLLTQVLALPIIKDRVVPQFWTWD